MEKILLPVKAKHFKDVEFCNSDGMCALDKAASEIFNTEKVEENVNYLWVGNKYRYNHERYGYETFKEDANKAFDLRYSDEIIRTIELIPT